jgi:hypothetical protein
MMRAWLARARRICQVLGAGLWAALGLRIMLGAISEARAQRAVAQVAQPESAKPHLVDLADEVVSPEIPPTAPKPEAKAKSGASLRLMLSVTVGPERSEIFVNGTRLGLSPSVGDFTCKEGEGLEIHVVPVHLPLLTRQAQCVGKTLLIRD